MTTETDGREEATGHSLPAASRRGQRHGRVVLQALGAALASDLCLPSCEKAN